MPKAKRRKPYNPSSAHDRRSRDLLRNAEVATVEVDNPLALEPGEKIVALRSIRNDPLARLDHDAVTLEARRRSRALSRRLSPSRAGMRITAAFPERRQSLRYNTTHDVAPPLLCGSAREGFDGNMMLRREAIQQRQPVEAFPESP